MKLVAFEMPEDWKLEETLVAVDIFDHVSLKHDTGENFESKLFEPDAIKVGGIYSSEDYKIITETEGDHMVFMVVRR